VERLSSAFDSLEEALQGQIRTRAMKKKAANTKTPARAPQSDAAKERVRRHLAGLSALSLDPVEAAGVAFISPEERARARYAEYKKTQGAAAARSGRKNGTIPPVNPRRKPRSA
jgi:hypothetical protein